MEIREIIKQKRLEKNMTMKQVADAVGVSEATVSRWESGEIANMKHRNIVDLANLLNIEPAILMGWDKEKALQEFGNRIRQSRNKKNWSQQELANKIGTSKSVISGYETGKNDPSQTVVLKLAKALDVSINYLMGKNTSSFGGSNITNLYPVPDISRKIPLVGTIAAGEPILAEQNIEEYIDLDKMVEADFCLRVQGDSMVNANINNGDIIFIRQQSDVEDGEIAAVLIEDEATLKRVYKIGDIVQLRAENHNYEPILLNGDKNVRILGKATYKLSKVM